MGAGAGGVKDATTAQLLIEATARLVEARQGSTPTPALLQGSLEALVQVVGRQDARIAALEAARAPEGQVPSKEAVEAFAAAARYWANRLGHPHGPPLEGTGPLPLERKGE